MTAIGLSRDQATGRLSGRRRFAFALYVATFVSFLVVPALYFLAPSSLDARTLIVTLLTWSGVHQAASFYIYFDKSGRDLVWQRPILAIAPPVIIAASMAVFFAFDWTSTVILWVILAYGAITVWHYQKQNVGIYSFWCLSKGQRASAFEKNIIKIGGVAGILSFWRTQPTNPIVGTFLQGYESALIYSSAAICAILIALAVYFVTRSYVILDAKLSASRSALLLCLVGFFTPVFFMPDKFLAFAIYGIAHGLQYCYLLLAIAGRGSSPQATASLANRAMTVFALFAVTGAVFYVMSHSPTWQVGGSLGSNFARAFIGLSFGISLSHFF